MLNKRLNIEFLSGKNFIDGEFVAPACDKFVVANPSTLKEIGYVPSITNELIISSIDSAQSALKNWSGISRQGRKDILDNFYKLILDNIEPLSKILTTEQGKPLEDAKSEIIYGANFLRWFSSQIDNLSGYISESNNPNQKILIEYEPVGVIAAITPWNFPSAMIARKIAPAIAAGCCAIIKPSELTPFSALAIALLAKESGIPDGVVNVITGNADKISDILCSDKRVKKISFTGSSRVGKILYKKSADTLKKLSLELGGNAPVIICEDANIEKTAKNLLKAKLRSTGQACTSPNRIFVHESIYDIIINNLVDRFSNLKIGNGFNQEVNIAPLINKVAVEKIARLLKDATSKGAKILTGGKLAEYYFDQNNNKSKTKIDHNFFEPTIIINCTKNMDIFREEIFGPVLAFYKFNNIDDVIEMANDTDYGLSAYIYTESTELSWKLSSRLDYGMVGINDALISNEIGAFGGRKESGFGVEGSKLGIYEYLNTKYKLVSY
jgi:succinate-semialdehyde dehydrogenase/glutarate-semialdehyde dehydrogenase